MLIKYLREQSCTIDMRTIRGRCHCGNIEYTLLWPDTGEKLAVRACSCSFCTKHAGVYTSHPDARLAARITDTASVNKYAFGTGTAKFYICSRCGVVPFVTSTIEGAEFAVVNVNTFEDVGATELDSSTTDFEDEDLAERLARRKQNWISHVSVESGDG